MANKLSIKILKKGRVINMYNRKGIPNELSSRFNTVNGRYDLIQKYKNSDTMYSGTNSDGEDVTVSIAESGIVLRTNQRNGWVRINYYDSEGFLEGETFEGRWK